MIHHITVKGSFDELAQIAGRAQLLPPFRLQSTEYESLRVTLEGKDESLIRQAGRALLTPLSGVAKVDAEVRLSVSPNQVVRQDILFHCKNGNTVRLGWHKFEGKGSWNLIVDYPNPLVTNGVLLIASIIDVTGDPGREVFVQGPGRLLPAVLALQYAISQCQIELYQGLSQSLAASRAGGAVG